MTLDENIVRAHRQVDTFSCIPMAIEFVLKLLGKMAADSNEHQKAWGNRKDGNFGDFDDRLMSGVRFRQQYFQERGSSFPLDSLFCTVASELASGRYVLIALREGYDFHNYVIYDSLPSGEFCAITKGRPTERIENVREMVRNMQGTDIMTYSIEAQA